MLRRIFLLAVVMAGCWLAAAAQDKYVALDNTNFPDQYFRTFLKAKFASNLKTENGVTYIDRTAVNEININLADGKVGTTQVYYTKIKSLQGIKLFLNLTKLTLPAISKTYTYQLGDIDVSGMPALATITNGTVKYAISVPANKGGGCGTTYSPATKFNISVTDIKADDCPKLKEVYLSGYKSLRSISLEGTTAGALEWLYVVNTGLVRLDVSRLTNLTNIGSYTSSIDRYWTDYNGITNAFDGMKIYSTFAVDHCSELTELVVGEHPWKMLSVNYCDKLQSVDLSGLPDLVRFCAVFHGSVTGGTSYGSNGASDHYNCDHNYRTGTTGALDKVIIGEGHKHLRVFNCVSAQLTSSSVDWENMSSTLVLLNVSYNKLTSFDVKPFTKVLYLDLGYNRIHHLDLPPNKSLNSLSITDNCLTRMDQFKPDGKLVYTSLPSGGRINPFQYIRVGKAYRYRILDDATEAQYVELEDDDASQKYFWAINGGHLGNPENDERIFGGEPTGRKEDPCFFYFDSPLTDGQYWYRNPYAKTDHFMHDWLKVTLCHSDEIDFDPDQTFYLSGEFNNWQPSDNHAFVYNPATEQYELQLGDNEELRGSFRIWNHKDPSKVSLDLGGHSDESVIYPGKDSHIFFQPVVDHMVDTDVTRHYSTFRPGEDNTTGGGYRRPLVEMRLLPGNSAGNYVRIVQGIPTGVGNIDNDDADAPVELFDMNGLRIGNAAPAPGIYIRRQGRNVTKIVIR